MVLSDSFSSANYGDEKRFVKRITSSKNENYSKANSWFCSQESFIDPDLAIEWGKRADLDPETEGVGWGCSDCEAGEGRGGADP